MSEGRGTEKAAWPAFPDLTPGWLLACVLLGLVWYLPIPPRYFTPDSLEFLEYARCIQQNWHSGGPLSPCSGAGYWPPLLPLLLSLLTELGLEPVATLRGIALLSQALLPLPVFILGRYLAGATAGRWAALLVVLCTALRVNALLPDARQLGLLLSFLAWAVWVRWAETGRGRWMVLVGLLLGAATQLRSETQLSILLSAFLTVHFRLPADPSGRYLRPGRWISALRSAVSPLAKLFGGVLAVVLPLQLVGLHYQAQARLFPRAWESLIVGWMAFFPLDVFIPLFGIGGMATPLRRAVEASLATHPETAPLTQRLQIVWELLQDNLHHVPSHLSQAVPGFLLPLAVLGLVWVGLRPAFRGRLLLWGLLLFPLLPLIVLPQTFNPRMPESNLLFLSVVMSLMGGAGLAGMHTSESIFTLLWCQFRQTSGPPLAPHPWRSRLALGLTLLLSLGLMLNARWQYEALLHERGDGPFDSSPLVMEAAAWLNDNTRPQARVVASLSGSAVPILAGHPRLSFPSYWEVPGALTQLQRETGSETLLVLTSLDHIEAPLAVAEWLKRAHPNAPLSLAYFAQAKGQWVAIFRLLPSSGSAF